jgi:hypothetical protein
MSTKTRLTKSGQPVMGTTIEIHTTADEWEACKVVGKGFGRDGHTLVMIVVEWSDGVRQAVPDFGDLVWRPQGIGR